MAEIKIDCPVCFDTNQCFEDTVENKDGEFKSYSPSVANATTLSPDDKPNTLLGMRCGHMYLITLKTIC